MAWLKPRKLSVLIAIAAVLAVSWVPPGPAGAQAPQGSPQGGEPAGAPAGGDLVGQVYDPCARLGKRSPAHRLVPEPLRHATNGVFVEGDDYACFPDGYLGVDSSGTVMVPLSALAQNVFGFSVRWDAKARAAVLRGRGADGKQRTVVVKPGSRTITVNGVKKTLGRAATVYEWALAYCYVASLPECVRAGTKPLPGKVALNRIYAPLDLIPLAFGAKAEWDGWLVRIKR